MIKWILSMAWRDSRGSRSRLLLFVSSMGLGVAALVAIHGFGANLRQAVDDQARELYGADLGVEGEQPFSGKVKAFLDSLGGERSRRISFTSMAYFPEGAHTRLARVRAIEGDFPFYGALETVPAGAAEAYRSGGEKALVDATLMNQFQQSPGDSVRIGRTMYEIAGSLQKMPQESAAVSLVSPRIYLPLAELDSTLLGTGSRAEYEMFFELPPGRDAADLVEEYAAFFEKWDLDVTTAEEAAEGWSEGLTDLYRFLSLVAFVALLLGGLGIASAVHVYIKQRLETVAVLRCVGATTGRTFLIYLVQAAAMGGICAVAGTGLGLAVQGVLPEVLADFLPVDVPFRIEERALFIGAGVGVGGTLLFALLPLISVRRVSPLRSLRADYDVAKRAGPDLLRWALYVLLVLIVSAAAVLQAPSWEIGLGYAGGLAVVFGVLALLAKAVMYLTRRYLSSSLSYPFRQGLSNLFRPRNQTVMLTLALGFGTFLVITLYLLQATLLAQVQVSSSGQQPNLIFFDVQSDQVDSVARVVREEGYPVLDKVPIVPMRLSSVQGQSVEALQADSTREVTWAHRRMYRSTYRDSLASSERITAGTFRHAPHEGEGPVPVSVEEGIAEELGVGLGDTLTFDVQGLSVETVVASLREVDWQRVSTNFFVVFPPGVLEKAPTTYVLLSRTPSPAASGRLQAAVVEAFPSVSAIDVGMVLDVLDQLLSRLAFVIRFMGLFSIMTGLIVLAGAVLVSRYQRMEESVLLKTLGATRGQVFRIMLIEYFFLGLLAAGAGISLALVAGWLLTHYVFEAPFFVNEWMLVVALLVVTGLTMGIGLFNSRDIYRRPPMTVLRAE